MVGSPFHSRPFATVSLDISRFQFCFFGTSAAPENQRSSSLIECMCEPLKKEVFSNFLSKIFWMHLILGPFFQFVFFAITLRLELSRPCVHDWLEVMQEKNLLLLFLAEHVPETRKLATFPGFLLLPANGWPFPPIMKTAAATCGQHKHAVGRPSAVCCRL